MEFAPFWIVDKALKQEIKNNENDAVKEIHKGKVPKTENLIPSHILYKVRGKKNNKKRLETRLCPNGNRDKMKMTVRKDSATAQFDGNRLFLSLATFHSRLICVDIKGAYLQRGPLKRRIYMGPSHELWLPRYIL